MEDGFQFGLKERGGVIAGRKVQAFFGDSAGQPAQTRTKAQELVERDHVHVLTGPVAAFEGYAITCGITFTFGGLRIDRETGQVLNVHFHRIPGLYCAGEMVGGLFYFNYPSGTGLVSGAVFGRIAGRGAAAAK